MAHPWIGTITPKEMVALAEIKIVPIGQVFGTSFRSISTLYFPTTSSEVRNEVEAFQMMLEDSMNSLRNQATQMGANGVIDMKMVHTVRVDQSANGSWLMSTTIVGTAVSDQSRPQPELFTAGISANDIVMLRRAGFEPCGLVVGNSSYYKVAWRQIPKVGPLGFWANQEVSELTEGPYIARELAMTRMGEMARACGGSGIIGVTTESEVQTFGTLTAGNMAAFCRMRLTGTAIRRNSITHPEVNIQTTISVS